MLQWISTAYLSIILARFNKSAVGTSRWTIVITLPIYLPVFPGLRKSTSLKHLAFRRLGASHSHNRAALSKTQTLALPT